MVITGSQTNNMSHLFNKRSSVIGYLLYFVAIRNRNSLSL